MSYVRTHSKPLLLLLLLLQTHLVVVHSLLASTGTFMNHTAMRAVPCVPDHASALLRLKRSFATTNDSIAAFRSWRAGTDCCGWEGIRCRGAKGRVTSLDLSDRGLQSRGLNPTLFDLTSLEYLNLANNDFGGSWLPSTGFERLVQLTHLNLSGSGFDGQVPSSVRQLTNLVSLDLSTGFEIVEILDGSFKIVIHSNYDSIQLREPNFEALIAKLGNLRELKLGHVDLSDSGARWCDALARSTPKLRLLSLPWSGISGPICNSLSSLHSLEFIDLGKNHLSGPVPDFLTDFSNLTVLQVKHNKLDGWVSSTILGHKKLVTFDLYHNLGISGHLPIFSTSHSLENLDVGQTNFSGTIPNSISNLKSLKRLGLSAPGFSGELPLSIGQLRSLDVLEISGRGFAGSVPSWVANLSSLKTLKFSECGLSGSIPSFISDLKKLERLMLYNCSFSGKIPSQISNLTQLQILYLNSNNLFGTVKLTWLGNLPHLYAFDVSNNHLDVVNGEDNSSLLSFPKIDMVGLSGCNLYEFPNFLTKKSKRMEWLDLSHNKIHGPIPHWVWRNSGYMLVLNLAHNQFDSIGDDSVLMIDITFVDISSNLLEGTMPIPGPYTVLFDCSNNRFSSIPINFFSRSSRISFVGAFRNKLSGVIPKSICDVRGLQFLDMSYNNLSGSIPSCLMEDASSLSILNLKANQLEGELPRTIKKGCGLNGVDLSDNLIKGQLPRSLVACGGLQVMDIGNNQISDTFPCWMSMLPQLQVLVLRSNNFFGELGPSPLGKKENNCEFVKLRILSLASNNFSGILPNDWFNTMKSMMVKQSDEILFMEKQYTPLQQPYAYRIAITYKGSDVTFSKILKALVVIDVSDNALHGCIPKSIGELVLLHGLNMSNNAFNGTIPSQLGALHQLESLDLSSNGMSGEIPPELTWLDFLSKLNLSYNELDGRIPESPHFQTFSDLSFVGNVGLCGLPLSKQCDNTTPNAKPHPMYKEPVDTVLFLFTGLGFGVGIAVTVILKWGIRIRK